MTVAHASGYNPDAAVNYAAAHWNDGVGVCDEFVKACLSAGGVNINAGGVANVKNALNAYGTSYALVTSGNYINASDNSGKISAGDPIFFYCSADGYVHVAICGGIDSSGHVCAFGHNAAWNNNNYLATYHDGNGHNGSYITVYSVHMSTGGSSGGGTSDPDAGAYTAYVSGTDSALAINDWAAPSPSGSNQIGRIPEGEACTVYPGRSIGNWYYVSYNGVSGYAYGKYLTTTKPATNTITTTNGTYYVTIPANYEVSCYTNATDTSRSRHINASGSSFELSCDQKVTFSNGSVRYHFNDADGNSLYFDYVSSMSVRVPVAKYTISYDANGGSGAPGAQIKTQDVSLTLSSTVPARNGYVFKGWSTSASAIQAQYPAGGTYNANANAVLYAVWQQNAAYSITYNANGGTGAPGAQEKTQDVSLTLSSTIPLRSGYVFKGWSTSASATQAQYPAGGTYNANANAVLYAVWQQNAAYSITYNANGGTGAPNVQTKNKDEALTISSVSPKKIYRLTFDANGGTCTSNTTSLNCAFMGWNTSSDGSGSHYYAGANYSDNSDLTLYAQWENPTVGSALPAATRNGYIFDGWYTQAVGGKQIESGSIITASVTLFAHWTQQQKSSSFQDVEQNDFYYKPVLWAADKGITSGTSATTFSPESYCTRAQVVTFLWRAKGSPIPNSSNSKFTDVSDNGSYSSQAIIWATENGITSGVSATQFAPNDSVTRGQFVTFLWRSASQPYVSGSSPFTDVSENSYYFNSVIWAYVSGITSGTSATTFSPDSICTRGQVVTFLYRYMGK
jgi:uncharacterized repeat protein (TIGR02543 family)